MPKYIDYLIVACWAFFAMVAGTSDMINLLAGPGYITDAKLEGLAWPPQLVKDTFLWYTADYDPTLRENPLWLYAGFLINALMFFFYCWAIPKVLRQDPVVRAPALVWGGMMFIIMWIYLLQEIWGVTPGYSLAMTLMVNGSYMAVTVFVIWRFSRAAELWPQKVGE